MPEYTIVLGNRNYSSWSLRGWLALKRCGVDFQETVIELAKPDTREQILSYSKAGLVPVLVHGDLTIWETMGPVRISGGNLSGRRVVAEGQGCAGGLPLRCQ
jgi:hypothetical protein